MKMSEAVGYFRDCLLPITNLSLCRMTKHLTAAMTRASHVAGKTTLRRPYKSVAWSSFAAVRSGAVVSLKAGSITESETR